MNVTDKYPLLIGHFPAGRTELHSLQEVADFICTHGLYDDLLITTADGEPFISTFGIYIDRIADMGDVRYERMGTPAQAGRTI